ncbi:MAG TPA: type IV toxin-antitoxin system AbiEi family antitoxin domain-containing protein, partial [Solirubrobacteraceae bacterium]|nr:type IV toxin-antitoxin system AbiEi family antitoxin domain-containing protein [Solirubrobacteraceae bacterium]
MIARIAERQHGVVHLDQLRAAGLGDGAIYARVRAGRLHRIHRGVFAVGHRRPRPPLAHAAPRGRHDPRRHCGHVVARTQLGLAAMLAPGPLERAVEAPSRSGSSTSPRSTPSSTRGVDFLWPAQRLIVETDGHEDHGTRRAFERDRARDARLTVLVYRVVRFTWRRL